MSHNFVRENVNHSLCMNVCSFLFLSLITEWLCNTGKMICTDFWSYLCRPIAGPFVADANHLNVKSQQNIFIQGVYKFCKSNNIFCTVFCHPCRVSYANSWIASTHTQVFDSDARMVTVFAIWTWRTIFTSLLTS